MNAKEMWTNYTNQFCENKNKTYEAWHFSNDEKNANELAELVVNGEKTATASGFCFYKFEHEEIPKVGSFSIVLDWNDNAKCIIRISKVYTLPFNKVTKEHACKEGEGDKTLLYWRNVHKRFFSEELNEYKKAFNENMMVVCEEFEVVWK